MTEGSSKTFNDVFGTELVTILERRDGNRIKTTGFLQNDMGLDKLPPDLFGIALSGGGIRSASFCLGALQALDQYGLVRRADYLSTVSGGGYIGASMAAAITRSKSPAESEQDKMEKNREWSFPFTTGTDSDVRDNAAVSHIRDYSKFLAPRGLPDISVSAAILLRGLVVNFLLLLAVLVPLATIIILANPTREELDHSILLDLVKFFDWPKCDFVRSAFADPFILSKTVATLLAYWLVGWALWRSYTEYMADPNERLKLEQSGPGAKWGRRLLVVLLIVFAIEIQPRVINGLFDWAETSEESGSWFTPIVAMATAAISIMTLTAAFQATLVSWIQRALNIPTLRARLQALLARAAFYALGLALPLVIYGFFLLLVIWGIKDPGAPAGGYPHSPGFLVAPDWTFPVILIVTLAELVALRAWFIIRSKVTERPGRFAAAREKLKKTKITGFFIILAFLLVLIALGLAAVATRGRSMDQWIVLTNYLLLTAILLTAAANFTENANGLHRLYRDRLRVAFRLDDEKKEPIRLDELHPQSPYLLINGTLNVRRQKGRNSRPRNQKAPLSAEGSDEPERLPPLDPAKRGRNAEFFLFSRHFIGSDSTRYAPSDSIWRQQPELDLAAAAAISGAAVSSSMGRIGIGVLGPTLALLNLRLGCWLPHPTNREDPQPGDRSWDDILRLYLFAEAFGRLSSDSSRVYVTDGGHIDNIGLYQLLKRRCKFIIVIDAEADAGMNFSAFSDVQRFARIDEGVRISLEWRQMRATALARLADRSKITTSNSEVHQQHFAVGRIQYRDGGSGILLYVKATVTGDEADYVLDYERRYPDFPHEATSDQFFSEEQMEAYRALGFHAVNMALDQAPPFPVGGDRAALVKEMKQALNAKTTLTRQ